MPRDGTSTRTAIMDAAEDMILEQGYAATSVDRVIRRAGVTKGTFFYHFPSKATLAHALVARFAQMDADNLETNMARAEALARDPLQQVLIFVGLFREELAELTEPYPGCLFATYIYEAGLFDDEILAIVREAMRAWRKRLGDKLREVAKIYPARRPADADELADMITVVFEGAFVLSKTLGDARLVAEQLDHYRAYLELLFSPEI